MAHCVPSELDSTELDFICSTLWDMFGDIPSSPEETPAVDDVSSGPSGPSGPNTSPCLDEPEPSAMPWPYFHGGAPCSQQPCGPLTGYEPYMYPMSTGPSLVPQGYMYPMSTGPSLIPQEYMYPMSTGPSPVPQGYMYPMSTGPAPVPQGYMYPMSAGPAPVPQGYMYPMPTGPSLVPQGYMYYPQGATFQDQIENLPPQDNGSVGSLSPLSQDEQPTTSCPKPSPPKTSTSKRKRCGAERKEAYIRRPPNAFMIFMKENRENVSQTQKPKHSAEANTILGQMWRKMSPEEQLVYYLKAEVERKLHSEKHPEWSSKDNYGKKVKRQRRKSIII